jgi:hypothetical protein
MIFGSFRKCLYREQKFDSDSERRFAGILENDKEVLKWFKPAKGNFQIHYSNDGSYEPDFVAETKTAKFLCEPKSASEVDNLEEVLAKAKAASEWCKHAFDHKSKHVENLGNIRLSLMTRFRTTIPFKDWLQPIPIKDKTGGRERRKPLFPITPSCVEALGGPCRPLACSACNNRHEGKLQATCANGLRRVRGNLHCVSGWRLRVASSHSVVGER